MHDTYILAAQYVYVHISQLLLRTNKTIKDLFLILNPNIQDQCIIVFSCCINQYSWHDQYPY